MLVGVHERQLDDKGRLALPSSFREQFDDRCYLVLGQDRCVNIHSRESFESTARDIADRVRLGELPMSRQRAIAHSATPLTIDKQGRITLGDELRQYARLPLGARVVVAGNVDWVEVWNLENYERIASDSRGLMAGGAE
jgi:MraZ protein